MRKPVRNLLLYAALVVLLTMRKPVRSLLLYAALVVLYLLHNDLWLWNDPRLVLGLPAGLAYHVGFCIATSIVLTLLVIYAWPEHLDLP